MLRKALAFSLITACSPEVKLAAQTKPIDAKVELGIHDIKTALQLLERAAADLCNKDLDIDSSGDLVFVSDKSLCFAKGAPPNLASIASGTVVYFDDKNKKGVTAEDQEIVGFGMRACGRGYELDETKVVVGKDQQEHVTTLRKRIYDFVWGSKGPYQSKTGEKCSH